MNSSVSFVQIIALVTVLSNFLTCTYGQDGGDRINCFTVEKIIKPFLVWDARHGQLQNEAESVFYNKEYKSIECSHEGDQCFDGLYDSSVKNATCVTKYAYVQLYYGSKRGQSKLTRQEGKVGVGCSCRVSSLDSSDDF